MILPEPREPWGWHRQQRIMLAALLAIGLCVVYAVWRQRPARLPGDNPPISHQPIPELETRIDPNTATAASLSRIPGIGPQLAQRIVAFREARMPDAGGPVFVKLADLGVVPGIGRKKLEQMRPWLQLREMPALSPNGLLPARTLEPESAAAEESE
jgi:competence ComEA-like helix-hairpin-helix protein